MLLTDELQITREDAPHYVRVMTHCHDAHYLFPSTFVFGVINTILLIQLLAIIFDSLDRVMSLRAVRGFVSIHLRVLYPDTPIPSICYSIKKYTRSNHLRVLVNQYLVLWAFIGLALFPNRLTCVWFFRRSSWRILLLCIVNSTFIHPMPVSSMLSCIPRYI